jgi:hypothetical protein
VPLFQKDPSTGPQKQRQVNNASIAFGTVQTVTALLSPQMWQQSDRQTQRQWIRWRFQLGA